MRYTPYEQPQKPSLLNLCRPCAPGATSGTESNANSWRLTSNLDSKSSWYSPRDFGKSQRERAVTITYTVFSIYRPHVLPLSVSFVHYFIPIDSHAFLLSGIPIRVSPPTFSQRLCLSCIFFSHPWSHVVIGMWHKYPNSKCTHVVSIDTINRSIDPQTGIIRTERVLGCKQKAPMWIVKVSFIPMLASISTHISILQLFGGSEDAFVREISFVDPGTQNVTITSVNLSLSQFATCYEQIHYTPASATQTSFLQTAEIQARMALWRSAADGLEKWLVQRFEQNAQLGKSGFTDVLRNLWEERHRVPSLGD